MRPGRKFVLTVETNQRLYKAPLLHPKYCINLGAGTSRGQTSSMHEQDG
jgi:hypothetical protein